MIAGHTLMIGDMGRAELASTVKAGALALVESAQRLRALPDNVEVLPGALSGSVRGRHSSGKATSTVGFERRCNKAFVTEERDAFVDAKLREIAPPLLNASARRAANLGKAVVAV